MLFPLCGLFFLPCFIAAFAQSHESDSRPLPNAWSFGQEAELYVYASKEPLQTVFDDKDLLLHLKPFRFGDHVNPTSSEHELSVDLASKPLYLHVHLMKAGVHPDPLKAPFDPTNSVYRRFPLLRTMKRPAATANLLAGTEKPEDGSELVPYWYPEMVINLVNAHEHLPVSHMPPFIRKYIYVDRIRRHYLPIVYVNDFWELKSRRVPLLDGTPRSMPLKVTFSTISLLKFQLMAQFDHSIKTQEGMFGENGEFEQIKQMLLETSTWLIILTVIISLLHSVFDFLAFKNDVQFWRKQKDMQGLSVRSVLINSLFQVIIFFYLLDNETSYVVLASVGIGALIELWKITRIFDVRWRRVAHLPLLSVPVFTDRVSYVKSQTREHDETAVRYLTIASVPLLIGYSVYSLMYQQHKTWYSWMLRSLVGFVYSFGFISMTPQLFINYKLKSVAHMPWKAFTYKALNTFIDDLFAFVIKMPWMHRVACFRDDILFIIYLYQRWIYPTDMKRANEFGQVFVEETEAADQLKQDDADTNDTSGKEEEFIGASVGASVGESVDASVDASVGEPDGSKASRTGGAERSVRQRTLGRVQK